MDIKAFKMDGLGNDFELLIKEIKIIISQKIKLLKFVIVILLDVIS